MIVLAIDTATPQVGVALRSAGGPIGSFHAAQGRRHGEVLAPAIGELCGHVGVALSDVGLVAVDLGPGLFTGLRVGLATAKALAAALAVPALGVTSLEVLAQAQDRRAGLIAPVVDVRRGEVAWALYAREGEDDDALVELRPPAVAAPEDVAAALVALDRPVLAAGDGAERYRPELAGQAGVAFAGQAGVAFAGPDGAFPSAATLARLAVERAGQAGDPRLLVPCYLRQADVRIGWEQAPAAPLPSGGGPVPEPVDPSLVGRGRGG